MGRSASRLSRTRSGVVRLLLLDLAAGIAGLSLAAPIPPLALFAGQARIARLRHGGAKNVEAADIHPLAGFGAQALVQLFGILTRELRHAANAEQVEIAKHGRADGDEIPEAAVSGRHEIFSLTAQK